MNRKSKKLVLTVSVLAISAFLFFIGQKLYYRIKYHYYYEMASELSITFNELKDFAGVVNDRGERMFGMLVESSRENWDKLAELAAEDDRTTLGAYFYNLANAMNGRLGERLMYHYQPFGFGLFIPINENTPIPELMASGEVWYQLGEMTMAEHNTIMGMLYSPAHKGPRFFRRMAEINMVNGDESAARKYLRLLGDTLDGRWREKSKYIQKDDVLHILADVRPALKGLIESNPDNLAAYEYLLCYDLLMKDIPSFIEDYVPGRKDCKLYQEVALVHLAPLGEITPQKLEKYGISDAVFRNFNRYNENFMAANGNAAMLGAYHNTYWYYYHFTKLDENENRK